MTPKKHTDLKEAFRDLLIDLNPCSRDSSQPLLLVKYNPTTLDNSRTCHYDHHIVTQILIMSMSIVKHNNLVSNSLFTLIELKTLQNRPTIVIVSLVFNFYLLLERIFHNNVYLSKME